MDLLLFKFVIYGTGGLILVEVISNFNNFGSNSNWTEFDY